MNMICVQEQHLPGESMEEKWDIAQEWGFDGIELRGKGDFGFRERLPELRRAAARGIPMPTVCVEMMHFIGAFDAEQRQDAIVQMKSLLDVMAEIGGRGAMTPASYGMFSDRLPPFVSPRSTEEDRKVLIDGLGQVGAHAATLGVELYLEPLNRYENHMVRRLDDAVSLIKEIGLDSVKVAADTYHMNIEEADPAAALLAAGPYIGHVQASDSNRLEPGSGHIDWALFGSTIRAIGYTGPIALESRLSGPAQDVLPASPVLLRRFL
ncbi:sugar phosphate isomerase/epimerase family protein [Pseudarthrobacter sp. SSS035]|uniref:sugar phosphate isomerase/epimerase family protein n=1 Tax=Pseudarthrobacter sp. SSS035 TaxID=2931399 RepID=UPI00200BDE61|nr:sugar phosphate isomerase/epimerase family protein [Pseudarthrobacter sp. SSS035]